MLYDVAKNEGATDRRPYKLFQTSDVSQTSDVFPQRSGRLNVCRSRTIVKN
jgi:hypothetical protein